jgi:hypothetical protein
MHVQITAIRVSRQFREVMNIRAHDVRQQPYPLQPLIFLRSKDKFIIGRLSILFTVEIFCNATRQPNEDFITNKKRNLNTAY